MELKKYKKEIILVAVLLGFVCAFWFVNRLLFSGPAGKVEISVDGQVVKTLSLDKEEAFVAEGYGGGTNHIIIEAGKVSVTEATCPDKVCVKQGWISQNGESLVCLPNRMIARIIRD